MTEAIQNPKVLIGDDEPNIRTLDPLGPPPIHTQRGFGYSLSPSRRNRPEISLQSH